MLLLIEEGRCYFPGWGLGRGSCICEIGILKARSLIFLGSFSYCSALSIPLPFRDPLNDCHSMTVMSLLCFRSARIAKMDEWLGWLGQDEPSSKGDEPLQASPGCCPDSAAGNFVFTERLSRKTLSGTILFFPFPSCGMHSDEWLYNFPVHSPLGF